MSVDVILDTVLAWLTVLLAIATAYTAFEVIARLTREDGKLALPAWVLGSAATGIGVWSTQLTALQALEEWPGGSRLQLMVYDLRVVGIALLASIVLAAIATHLLVHFRAKDRTRVVGGGALGLAVIAVHGLCVFAMRAPVELHYNKEALSAAVLLLVGATVGASRLAVDSVGTVGRERFSRLFAAIILGLSIAGFNLAMVRTASFSLMAVDPPPGLFPRLVITDLAGAAIAAGTLVILFFALVGSYEERQRLERDALLDYRRKMELDQLREMDRLKRDFLNATSHELRTPLSAIVGYAEFLEDELAGQLNPEQHDFVRQIQGGAERLQRLVDDLLDFARLEAGTFHIVRQEADLAALVRQELAMLEPQARAAGVTLAVEAPADAPRLLVDAKRIGQVLLNLVGNAIKFNRRDGRVTVAVVREPEAVRVEVRDTGIGIAPEHLPRLFEKFYQVDPSTTREHGGAGLGLAISRAIVEAHGGRLEVESQPDHGSTFWFRLPNATRQTPVAAGGARDG